MKFNGSQVKTQVRSNNDMAQLWLLSYNHSGSSWVQIKLALGHTHTHTSRQGFPCTVFHMWNLEQFENSQRYTQAVNTDASAVVPVFGISTVLVLY